MKTTKFLKVLSLVLCLIMMLSALAACDIGKKEEETTTKAPEETTTKNPSDPIDPDVTPTDPEKTIVRIPDDTDFGGAEVKALIWKENRSYLFPEQVDGEDIRNVHD